MNNTKQLQASISKFSATSLLSIDQLDRDSLDTLYALADDIIINPGRYTSAAKDKIMAAVFYEPSTRTSSSFIAAIQRLGGGVIPITGVEFSSVTKGETLEDTVTMLSGYSDLLVLRHPEPGTAQRAKKASRVPIINAGDGVGEHPTQALLDGYTISKKLGKVDNITVTMVGDLKHGRTVHSLARLLTNYDNVSVNYVSPEILKMPKTLIEELDKKGLKQSEHSDIDAVIGDTDVLYITRVQKERFTDLNEYESLKNSYVVTPDLMQSAKDKMIVMHPLPRLGEISTDVDDDPRAVYFDQAKYGMYVRMALIASILGKG